MQLPREVIVGKSVLEEVGEACGRLNPVENALVVTGPKVKDLAAKRVLDSLSTAGFQSSATVVSSSTVKQVATVRREIRKRRTRLVVGVGGGKDIDVAKMSSARAGIPFVSVPTTASHDGIASPVVSMKGLSRPYSVMAHAPLAIVADIGVIMKSPYRLTASGCGDVIAKYTAVRDWRLAHRIKNEYYGDYAADLALMSSRLVMRNAAAIRSMSNGGIRTLVEALISCGVAMSIAGSSHPCSGSEHLFSHALSRIAPNPALHGEQCGVGTILCAYLHGANWRMVRSVLEQVGAPTTAEQLGVENSYIVKALTTAHTIRPDRYTILGETGLTEEAAKKVAHVTGVIS